VGTVNLSALEVSPETRTQDKQQPHAYTV